MVWLIDTPKVDEFALASDCNVFRVLPFYLEALEVRIQVFMVEAGDLSTVRSLAVPDVDLTHEASSSDQIVGFGTEFALHEVLVEDFHIGYFYVAFEVDAADTGDHVGARRDELVTLSIPVD